MKITVIGTGYVGLVSGTCLSDLGNTVVCVDKNVEKLAILKSGKVPFYEPSLAEKIERNFKAGRLRFTDDLSTAVTDSNLIFIAVGTPPLDAGGADLSDVFSVVNSVIAIVKASQDKTKKVLVTKSTVPVGTGRKIMDLISDAGLDSSDLAVLSNPEFLREGSAVYDFFHPDRIVIGSDDEEALDLVSNLYEPLYRNKNPMIRTQLESSELSKYASNAFLATKISFINEMANLCERLGADVKDVSKIMGLDGRIGRYFLHAGPGYGGSCFPKDTKALVKIAEDVGYDLKIVKAAESVNTYQKARVFALLKDKCGDLKGKTIGILGLAFKPDTDDIREAPSLVVIADLLNSGVKVRVYDPEAMGNGRDMYGRAVTFCESSYDAAQSADALLLMTEWNTFKELDFARLGATMSRKLLLDFRNVYEHGDVAGFGFESYHVGRNKFLEKN